MVDTTRREVLKYGSVTGFSLSGIGNALASEHGDQKDDDRVVTSNDELRKVHGFRLETSFVYRRSHLQTINPKDTQFVFANISSSLPRKDLILEVDNKECQHGLISGVFVDSTVLARAEGVEALAGFELPVSPEATSVRLLLSTNDGRETLAEFDSELVEQLNNPSEFEVMSFQTPGTGRPDVDFPMKVKVRNTGGRPGTFFATIGRGDSTGAERFIALPVDPGKISSGTILKKYGPAPVKGGNNRFDYRLDWGAGTATDQITINP